MSKSLATIFALFTFALVNGQTDSVSIDCEALSLKWTAEVKAKPADTELMKLALREVLSAKCNDGKYIFDIALSLYSLEKSSGLATLIASEYLKRDDTVSATKYLNDCISLASDSETLKYAHLQLVGLLVHAKKYDEARTTYLALASKGIIDYPTAYTKIGDLYMKTAKEYLPPPEVRDPITNQGAYFAAYDMYEKAENEKKMNAAKQALPSKHDIFICPSLGNESYKEGSQTEVYGWIGGTATIRYRDQ